MQHCKTELKVLPDAKLLSAAVSIRPKTQAHVWIVPLAFETHTHTHTMDKS